MLDVDVTQTDSVSAEVVAYINVTCALVSRTATVRFEKYGALVVLIYSALVYIKYFRTEKVLCAEYLSYKFIYRNQLFLSQAFAVQFFLLAPGVLHALAKSQSCYLVAPKVRVYRKRRVNPYFCNHRFVFLQSEIQRFCSS